MLDIVDASNGLLAAAFVAAAAAVWVAGTRLARYADAIAGVTGMGRAFLGMVLLGGVTSLPEFAVAVTATVGGHPLLAINDVLGAASINLVLLAMADAFIGRKALTSTLPSSAVMLQGALSIALLAMVPAAVLTGDRAVLGMGIWSWLMLATYIAAVAMLGNAQSTSPWSPRGAQESAAPLAASHGEGALARLLWRTGLAALVIITAGFVLAETGAALAQRSGLGTSFFGAVFLAVSTTLPETSTVLAAVRLRQYEMAISDVIGTNLFNVTILVLIDALHPGEPVLQLAGRFAGFAALLALLLTATFLTGMLERRDRTVLRMGQDSAVVLVAYAIGVFILFRLR